MVDYLVGVFTGIFVGVAGKYFADKYTDQRKQHEKSNERRKVLDDCERIMPGLFDEMRRDLKEHPLAREFVLLSKRWVYNSEPNKVTLCYFYEDHNDLTEKVTLLASNGFVEDVQFNSVARFQMTEEFAKLLLS